MVINLKLEYEQKLKRVAEATGRTVDDVIESAIDREVRERTAKPSPDKMTPEQKADMLSRIDEIGNIPPEGDVDDAEFVHEDHDKIVYKVDW